MTEATSEDLTTRKVEIRESSNGFVPPKYVYQLVFRMLATVPPKYFNGLGCVVLTNQSGAPRRWRLGKVSSRKRRVPQERVLARYHQKHDGKPAWVELYVDKLVTAISYHPWVPMGRTAVFAHVLFRELSHHVHTALRPEFREKEDVADD